MKLDGPSRAGDRSLALVARDDVIVAQHLYASELPRLADSDLNAGIVDKGVFAADQAVLEEARIFAHLPAALDFCLGDVLYQQGIELAAVATDDARTIAQQFVRPGRWKQKHLSAWQIVFTSIVQIADELRDLVAQNAVVAVMCTEAIHIDAHQAKDHGWILHGPIAANEGLEAGQCCDVRVTTRIDGDVGTDVEASLLGPGDCTVDTLTLCERVNDGSMKQDLGARLGKQIVCCFAPDQRIVRQSKGLAVAEGIGDSALYLHDVDEAIGESEYNSLRSRQSVVRRRE